jgi:hypothetical protein
VVSRGFVSEGMEMERLLTPWARIVGGEEGCEGVCECGSGSVSGSIAAAV